LGRQGVDLRCENEVLVRQAARIVGAEREGDLVVPNEDVGVMLLPLREASDAIDEGHGIDEVREAEGSLEGVADAGPFRQGGKSLIDIGLRKLGHERSVKGKPTGLPTVDVNINVPVSAPLGKGRMDEGARRACGAYRALDMVSAGAPGLVDEHPHRKSIKFVHITIAFVIAISLFTVLISTRRGKSAPPSAVEVRIGGEKFELELAIDPAVRERGMGGRTEIPDHGGMLFVFPDKDVKVQSFWMKDCLIDMDIIYLDRQARVTWAGTMRAIPLQEPDESKADYETRLRSTATSSGYPSQFVIEVKAGTVQRLGVRVEDKIELDTRTLIGRAK